MTELGYSVAIRNGVGVALLVLAVGVLFRWAVRALGRVGANGRGDAPVSV